MPRLSLLPSRRPRLMPLSSLTAFALSRLRKSVWTNGASMWLLLHLKKVSERRLVSHRRVAILPALTRLLRLEHHLCFPKSSQGPGRAQNACHFVLCELEGAHLVLSAHKLADSTQIAMAANSSSLRQRPSCILRFVLNSFCSSSKIILVQQLHLFSSSTRCKPHSRTLPPARSRLRSALPSIKRRLSA